MKTRFSAVEVSKIIDQALIYQCACPAQVATTILELRDLFDYLARSEAAQAPQLRAGEPAPCAAIKRSSASMSTGLVK